MNPYGLEPEPEAPALPGTAVMRPDLEQVLDVLCADLHSHALNCVRMFGDFHLAVSVGGPQIRLYMRLMVDPAFRDLPWNRTHLWVTSETDVAGAGFGQIESVLADPAGIPGNRVHGPVAESMASDYQGRLQEALAWREKGHDRLDCVILGLDGAGRAVGLEAGHEAELSHVAPVDGGGMTMTPRLVNASRMIAVMAIGEETNGAVERIVSGGAGEHLGVDASVLKPLAGELRWYLDEAAGGV